MTIRGDAKHQSVLINRSIFRSNIRSFRYVAQQTRSVPKPKTCNKNWQNKEKPANECLSTEIKTIKIQRLRIELESTLWMTYARRPHEIRRTCVCSRWVVGTAGKVCQQNYGTAIEWARCLLFIQTNGQDCEHTSIVCVQLGSIVQLSMQCFASMLMFILILVLYWTFHIINTIIALISSIKYK